MEYQNNPRNFLSFSYLQDCSYRIILFDMKYNQLLNLVFCGHKVCESPRDSYRHTITNLQTLCVICPTPQLLQVLKSQKNSFAHQRH